MSRDALSRNAVYALTPCEIATQNAQAATLTDNMARLGTRLWTPRGLGAIAAVGLTLGGK
jgi:hypothetical protein